MGFERASGIKVNLSLKCSGETLAQLRAEKQNTETDVWFGGTGDPHLIAVEEGLNEAIDTLQLPGLSLGHSSNMLQPGNAQSAFIPVPWALVSIQT